MWVFLSSIPMELWIIVLLVFLIVVIVARPTIDIKNKKISFRQPKVRACKDCISIIRAKSTAFELAYWSKTNSILRNQMNYCEFKMIEIERVLGYELNKWFHKEVKRSFMENNFGKNNEEFDRYLEGRYEVLLIMLNCPENKEGQIKHIIREIYQKAWEVKKDTTKELNKMEEEFNKEINDMIKI